MDEIQFPSVATIKAFGGPVETAKALGLKKQNIDRWRTSNSGFIPRWWSDRIKTAAETKGVKLPKPKRVTNGHR